MSPHEQEPGYESWPAIDELFPVAFQGVNHNRGIEYTVIDYDRKTLADRLKAYIEAATYPDAAALAPAMAADFAGYEPKNVWEKLHGDGFDQSKIMPFLTFPLDQRWIYYETEGKLLNRSRPEFGLNLSSNEFLVTVPEPRKVSETRPLYATTLVNLHVHERGSVVIPRETRGADLLGDRDANLPEATWRVLRSHLGLSGERRDDDALRLAGRLLRVALALLHAPAYQADHKSALAADWAHLPVPNDVELFGRVAEAGDLVARLLDAHVDARDLIIEVLGEERAALLAQLTREGGGAIQPQDLLVSVNYWGGAKGRWRRRPFTAEEEALPL
ncbi:MAG: type ISP restriction/modification enzyme [Alphaproteobacteria bacterium]